MGFWRRLLTRRHPFRSETFPETRAAVAEYARGLPPEAEAFVLTAFNALANTVEKRRLGFSESSFIDIRFADGYDAAVRAFCDIEVLRPFLKAHGIRLETWHSEINIKPVEIPPAGSLGQVLLRNKRAWEAVKARRQAERDREYEQWLTKRHADARKTRGLAEQIRGR